MQVEGAVFLLFQEMKKEVNKMVIVIEKFNKLYVFCNVQTVYKNGVLTVSELYNGNVIYNNSLENINTLKIDGEEIISHNQRAI